VTLGERESGLKENKGISWAKLKIDGLRKSLKEGRSRGHEGWRFFRGKKEGQERFKTLN